tara:strand:- start:142 stop:384 length:243 start_codon:yes stop_codon:yes gene_type:complete
MRDKNTQIIDEVKKHIKSTKTNKSSSKNDLKDKDVVEVLDSKKTKSLDSMIEKEIKDWINLNADKISKEIIQETVKKLFK